MSSEGPYEDEKAKILSSGTNQQGEVLDAESIKAKFERQRTTLVRSGKLFLDPVATKPKTKALTTQGSRIKDFEKIIIFCPICANFEKTVRMWPHQLKEILHTPELYAELVGGIAIHDDETVFLHCPSCDLRLMPEIDDVEKLDARAPDEYIIESLNDPMKIGEKPAMAASKGRYNKARKDKEELYQKRRRQAMESLSRKESIDQDRKY